MLRMVVLLCSLLLVLCLYLLIRRYRQVQHHDSLASMPGPVSYPLLGTTYLYMRGRYSWDR